MTASRFNRIGGITLQIHSDLRSPTPLQRQLSSLAWMNRRHTVTLYHHFELPAQVEPVEGNELYYKPPWAIYQTAQGWLYLGIFAERLDRAVVEIVAVFNADHSVGTSTIPMGRVEHGRQHGADILSLGPDSDRAIDWPTVAVLSPFGGAVLNGAGFLFVGHPKRANRPPRRF
jgi:hypothetical protein